MVSCRHPFVDDFAAHFYIRNDCCHMVADCDLLFYLAYRSYDAAIAAYCAANIAGLVTHLD